MQNEASMNESKYSEQFYAQGEDGKDYQIEIELEDGPNAEDPEKITVVLNGERKTVDVPKGGTDDHYKKAIAAGLKEHGKYKLMEGKIPDMNEGKYPEFVKIESEDDYKNYVVPALGDILKKGYEFSDIKGLWFELDEDSAGAVPKGRRKTMRQILRLEGTGARFLESYSDRINNPLASEYVQGADAEWYGVKEDDLYEGKAPDVSEGKYPRFVQIKTMDDYNKYFVPTFGGDLLKKGYKFSELENAWWEIAPEEEGQIQPKARLKSMRQIVNNDFEPKFIYVENDILDLESAGSYISAMGVEPSDYGVREDDLFESKTSSKGQPMKITVKEMKCGEALSPKMQQRLKLKAWQNATLKLKGFEEAGYSFLDLWEDGKCNPICIAAEGKPTKEEATAAAKKMFDDFDEYVDVDSDFVPEGGPNGEDLWFPAYALKKTFANLPEDEGLTILSEISDVLYKVLVGDKRGGRRESNEEISPKLQDRLKFKEFAQFFNELPFFGQTIGDPLDTVRKEGLGYGVGNGSKEEQEEAAKDILSDFDDYVSWTTDQDTDGSWYIKMTFKPELWALPIEELKKVFGLLDDAFGPWS